MQESFRRERGGVYTSVLVKDDVIIVSDATLLKGVNKHSGKTWARFNQTRADIYSWKSGRLRVYRKINDKRYRSIADVTSSIVSPGESFGANRPWVPNWAAIEVLPDPFKIRNGLTQDAQFDLDYPLRKMFAPVDGLTPYLNSSDATELTQRYFRSYTRKDLIRAVGEVATWTNPRTASAVTQVARGMVSLVPVDWVVEWMKAEGSRSEHSFTSPKEVRRLFKTATDMQIRRALRNSPGQMQYLRDGLRSLEQIHTTEPQYRVSDLQFRDFKDLHDLLSRDYDKIKHKPRPVKYEKKAGKFAGSYEGFEIIAPETSYDLVEWGRTMSNCIGSYGHDASSGRTLLYAVMDQGKMVANIELDRSGNIRQLLGKHNRGVQEPYASGVKKAIKSVWSKADVTGGWQSNNWGMEF